jgi:endonuclease YncB( thermonuclease family)
MELTSLKSFERLTGFALFNDDADSTGDIPLGNITALANDYSPKTVEIPRASRGVLTIARRDTFQVTPVYTIDGNQFHTPVIPLLLMGDRTTDLSQTSATGATYTFTAKAGRAYKLPHYNVTAIAVTVSAAAKTLGTDFFVDDPNIPQSTTSFNGVIILPVTAAGIADGATVTVTYNKPVLTMEVYNAFTKLNRVGTLTIFLEDEYGPPAKEIWSCRCSLTVKKGADAKPGDFRGWQLEASLFGNPTVSKRPT